jgi:hypothetical protein
MKTTINVSASAFAVLFTCALVNLSACTKESGVSSGNTVQRQTNNSAQSNAASVFTSSSKSNISIPVFIPCANNGNGENVTLSGTLHETFHTTLNNNKFQLKVIDNPQGISGIGDVTGDKYQATGETEQQFGGSLNNGQYEGSYVNNFRIIGQGRGNNYLVHETFHVTVNANGTVTTLLDHLSVECK